MMDDEVKVYRSGMFWEVTFRRLVIEFSPRWFYFPWVKFHLLPRDEDAC